MTDMIVTEKTDGRELRLFKVYDDEKHWVLASDEDDAWAIYSKVFEPLTNGVDRSDVQISPCSVEWAKQAPFTDDDGTSRGTIFDECLRDPTRRLVATTCV